MNSSLPDNATLIIIDVQKGLDQPYWGTRCNPDAERNMARVLQAWRKSNRPIVHIQHLSTNPQSPLRPGQPGCEIKDEVTPRNDEPLFQKQVNSAFIGTGLEAYLRDEGLDTLVMLGLTTNHCISSSARMAGNLGFKTYVISDATAAFDLQDQEGRHFDASTVHAISLASLHEEFATVLTTEEVLLLTSESV